MTLPTRLWRAYILHKRQQDQQHLSDLRSQAGQRGNHQRWRERRITQHMDIVERVARQVAPMFARHIPIEDLISSGYVGLCVAADRYQPGRGKFAAFAWFHVRGAIIDAHKRQAYREEQNTSIDGIRERLGFLPADLARDERPLPDELAQTKELERSIHALVDMLPEQEAALFRAVMGGASVPAAARALGRSPAWGRARMAAARGRVGAGVMLR